MSWLEMLLMTGMNFAGGSEFAAAACVLMPHHQEARGVVRFVFDTLGGKA